MLYIMGMSHAISVLKAMDPGIDASHGTYGGPDHKAGETWAQRPLPSLIKGYSGLKVFLISSWSANIQNGVLSAPEPYWKLLESISSNADEKQCLISFVGGNEHSVLSMVEHRYPFDFYTTEYTSHPMHVSRQPIPLGVIENLLEKCMHNTVAMLTAARLKHPDLRIIHVMPPPPITSEEQIRRQPEIFRQIFETSGITPISIRVKIYHVYCRVLTEKLNALGISCMAHPHGVVDEFGGLLNDFALGCTHGNEAYGQLVAQQLALLLKD